MIIFKSADVVDKIKSENSMFYCFLDVAGINNQLVYKLRQFLKRFCTGTNRICFEFKEEHFQKHTWLSDQKESKK